MLIRREELILDSILLKKQPYYLIATRLERGGSKYVVDRQRIDLLNWLIDARVDLAAYVQLRKAKGYMSVSESNHLRDNFFKLNRELHDKSLRLDLHLDQEEWSALHHAEEALATAAVCLMSCVDSRLLLPSTPISLKIV